MPPKYAILMQPDQDELKLSQELAQLLESFLGPLLVVLDKYLDKRLVRTLVQCCVAIIRFRNNQRGLLFNLRPLGPIRVMGMEWTGTIITGLQGIPRLAVMRWWTTKGAYAEKMREKEEEILRLLVRKWGPLLTFVFDRGYASGPWLQV